MRTADVDSLKEQEALNVDAGGDVMQLGIIVGVRMASILVWEVAVVHAAMEVVVARVYGVRGVVLGAKVDCIGCLMPTGHHRTS